VGVEGKPGENWTITQRPVEEVRHKLAPEWGSLGGWPGVTRCEWVARFVCRKCQNTNLLFFPGPSRTFSFQLSPDLPRFADAQGKM